MLSKEEKLKIKEVVMEALIDLNVNPNINIAYYLDSINNTNNSIKSIESKMQMILQNQAIINQKIDLILRKIG